MCKKGCRPLLIQAGALKKFCTVKTQPLSLPKKMSANRAPSGARRAVYMPPVLNSIFTPYPIFPLLVHAKEENADC